MFVSLKQFRRNPKQNFIYDKELPASPAATKVPLPVLDCLSRADGVIPHTNYFLMLKEKEFVVNGHSSDTTAVSQDLIQSISKFYDSASLSDYITSNGEILSVYLEFAHEHEFNTRSIHTMLYMINQQNTLITELSDLLNFHNLKNLQK